MNTELISVLDKEGMVASAVVHLYRRQTMNERGMRCTMALNEVGFNAVDAKFLSSLAEQAIKNGRLTEKQEKHARGMLLKYHKQLAEWKQLPLPGANETDSRIRQEVRLKTVVCPDDKNLTIRFPYDPKTVADVRTLQGRRFDSFTKVWSAPRSVDNLQKLERFGFRLGDECVAWLKKTTCPTVAKLAAIPGLFPFQQEGVECVETRRGRILIGDEMGLGKTVQAAAWLKLHPELRPVLVVCPASLKLNWKKELRTWTGEEADVLSGKTGGLGASGITIINYDLCAARLHQLIGMQPKVLVLDECQYIKNRAAKRSKAVKELSAKIPHVIALSGTPIVNRPVEFFPTLNMLDKGLFPSFWSYAEEYCGAKHNGFGWDFNGATNTEKLHKLLTDSRLMIRRRKEDVLKDLPKKIRGVVPMEIDNASKYKQAETDYIKFLREGGEEDAEEKAQKASMAEHLVRIEGLKQLAAWGKIEMVREWIEDALDTNGKLVVMAVHKNVIDYLYETFQSKAVRLTGESSTAERQEAVDRFQNDPSVRLFIGNIKAAGVGITLTAASKMAIVELGWTPGEMTQAEDRIHRIGQKASVEISYLVASDTIEEEIAAILNKKQKVLDAVLDGKAGDDGEGLLGEVLAAMKERAE